MGTWYANSRALVVRKKSLAFTLAEILIVIGIIGIVAMMVIPTLIGDAKKQATTSQVLKVTSEISQALLMAQNDDKRLPDHLLGGDSPTLLKNYLLPYLRVATKCENGEPECGLTNFLCLHKRDSGLALPASAKRYILSDGTAIGFYQMSNNQCALYFDVNGNKGPNVAGYDTYIMVIDNGPNGAPAQIVGYGSVVYQECDDAHQGNGAYCYMRFRDDGNKITWWN